MFWDKVSPLYDLFETVYNSKVYRNTGKQVAAYISEEDVQSLKEWRKDQQAWSDKFSE